MKSGHLKNCITYGFVVIFLLLKVADLHVLTHSDNNDVAHCEICNSITNNDLKPIINNLGQDYVGNNYEFCFQRKVLNYYRFLYSTTTNITSLFSRPPPFSV